MRKISLRLLMILLLAVQGLTAVPALAQQPGGKSQGLPVKAAAVKIGTVSTEVSAVGTMLANESVIIRPEIAGRVATIHFTEGQAVAKGARLVTLDQAEYRAQLAQSEADAKLAERRFDRTEELRRQKFLSQEAVDDARNNLDRSVARRLETEVKLAKSEIRAPFSGIVGLRQVSPGAYVKEGADIARLEDIASIKLDFRIPELYLGKLRQDQEVSVRVDAYPDQAFSGRIYALEPVVDEKTRTVLVRAMIPNQDHRLRPGMFARVSLKLGSRENALLVPDQAIVPRGDNVYVFRVVDGKALLTQVETGNRSFGEVEILKGLSRTDVIVTDGQLKLQNGSPVLIMSEPPAAAAAPQKEG